MTMVFSHIRKNGHLIAIGVAAFVCTLVALAPASVIPALANMESRGVAFSNVEGTIWKGRIDNLTARGVLIGDVDFELSPLSLLALSPRIGASIRGGAVRGNASVTASVTRRLQISDTVLDIDLGPFAQRGILGSPVVGRAEVTVAEIVVTPAGCARSEASLWTDVLNAPARRFRGTDFPMMGDVRCDGADLIAFMSGESADGSAELELRVRPDFSYELAARARVADENLASALKVFGFEDQGGALIYGSAGVLRGVGS